MQYLHHICSPCAQHMCWPCAQHICKPYVAAYLQVAAPVLYSRDGFTLCDTFVRPVHHICKPCASWLLLLCSIFAGPCSIFASRTIFAGPAVHQSCRPCTVLLCPHAPVQHMCRPRPCASYLQALFLCSICTPCAAYLQPTVHHICIYLAGLVASASYLQVT